MILGSFIVTILSALIATPFAIGAAVFMTEVSPKGAKILQPAIELLVGIPSVVYGFIGLQVGGTICTYCLWWNRFRYFIRNFRSLCYDFADCNLHDNR